MACLRPTMPNAVTVCAPQFAPHGKEARVEDDTAKSDVHEARKGLLKAIWQASVAPRFSSKPIDMEDYFSDHASKLGLGENSAILTKTTEPTMPPTPTQDFRSALVSSSRLTLGERAYLENLLQSDDLDSIRRASQRLADKDLFPPADDPPERNRKVLVRRDSEVQQHLFLLHEKTTVKPSIMLRRMSFGQDVEGKKDEEPEQLDPPGVKETNSITLDDESGRSWDMDESEEKKWNPFVDVNSWIDGNQGVEVDGDGKPAAIPSPTSNPFKILGTSATDTSCHPHVLSPPLMEGLQGFMPESLHEHHYWLKYSLVRDGPSLMTMLRQGRASTHTILAIETTTGHVFGSFTSQPWRLVSSRAGANGNGGKNPGGMFYGTTESFVWRMRRSRNEPCKSIVEQALMESKIDVFPFTLRNKKIQLCTTDGLALGEGEVKEMTYATEGQGSKHFGNAIRLNGSLCKGSTSNSETFGNPCLIHTEYAGEEFEVANVELWCLTPHTSVAMAERAELHSLFLEEGRMTNKNLNLLEILVGTTTPV